MDYDDISIRIFSLICDSSKTIIKAYLRKLSELYGNPYNNVVLDFNEYTMNTVEIEYEST